MISHTSKLEHKLTLELVFKDKSSVNVLKSILYVCGASRIYQIDAGTVTPVDFSDI